MVQIEEKSFSVQMEPLKEEKIVPDLVRDNLIPSASIENSEMTSTIELPPLESPLPTEFPIPVGMRLPSLDLASPFDVPK